QPALIADTAYRRAFGVAQELFLHPPKQLRELRVIEPVTRREIGLLCHLGELVPGTDELAVVAAEDAVAHQRTQLFRDGVGQLDGCVGDAASRIQHVSCDDRASATYFEAGRAGHALRRGALVVCVWLVA